MATVVIPQIKVSTLYKVCMQHVVQGKRDIKVYTHDWTAYYCYNNENLKQINVPQPRLEAFVLKHSKRNDLYDLQTIKAGE